MGIFTFLHRVWQSYCEINIDFRLFLKVTNLSVHFMEGSREFQYLGPMNESERIVRTVRLYWERKLETFLVA